MDDNIARLAELQEKDGGGDKRPKQADVLIGLAAATTLFHTPAPDCDAFADIAIDGHRETHRVRGREFRLWLRHEYFKQTKNGCNADAMQVAVETIAAQAIFDGPEREVHVRVAEHCSGIYIDLGDRTWRAIKVSALGWAIVADPPVRFRRSPGMRTLPIPRREGSIESLLAFCNLSADGFVLLVSWALASLRPNANYPVLVITGEQGSAKSTLVRLIARLIDPRIPEQRSLPRDEDDLVVAAKGAHLLAYDNVSGIADWLSDAICRLATGGGAGKRKLYSDDDEVLFAGRRPVCLNGIEDVAERADLIDRSVTLALEPIPESKRRDEKEIDAAFERAAPGIFGALLDGLAAGLRHADTVVMPDKPRMADFALWSEACTRAWWPEGTFLAAYRANMAAAVEMALEASLVGDAVRRFMSDRLEWEGTAAMLLPLLTAAVGEQAARERAWPKRPNTLSGKLRRAAPALRKVGIYVSFERASHIGTRTIRIETRRKPEQTGRGSSPSSPSSPGNGKYSQFNDLAGDGGDDRVTIGGGAGDDPGDDGNGGIVTANPLTNKQNDDGDDGDDVLPPQSGSGHAVPSDVDAVLRGAGRPGQPHQRVPSAAGGRPEVGRRPAARTGGRRRVAPRDPVARDRGRPRR
jgi:hypothetical protein